VKAINGLKSRLCSLRLGAALRGKNAACCCCSARSSRSCGAPF